MPTLPASDCECIAELSKVTGSQCKASLLECGVSVFEPKLYPWLVCISKLSCLLTHPQYLLQIVDPEVEMINPADWDVVCDVRTPDEFEEDRILGAVNTPVLSNEQRAQIGTIYKQT